MHYIIGKSKQKISFTISPSFPPSLSPFFLLLHPSTHTTLGQTIPPLSQPFLHHLASTTTMQLPFSPNNTQPFGFLPCQDHFLIFVPLLLLAKLPPELCHCNRHQPPFACSVLPLHASFFPRIATISLEQRLGRKLSIVLWGAVSKTIIRCHFGGRSTHAKIAICNCYHKFLHSVFACEF